MTCARVLDLLLEADPADVGAGGPSAAAEHIRTCDNCQHVVARLRERHDALRAEFEAAHPRRSPAELADAVFAHVDAGAVEHRRRPSRGRTVATRVTLVALATAAALTLAVWGRQPQPPLNQASAPNDLPALVAVEVPPGRSAVVFETRNPLISVVWIY
jgi:hypothetical protein